MLELFRAFGWASCKVCMVFEMCISYMYTCTSKVFVAEFLSKLRQERDSVNQMIHSVHYNYVYMYT